jgi:hypothetical protein
LVYCDVDVVPHVVLLVAREVVPVPHEVAQFLHEVALARCAVASLHEGDVSILCPMGKDLLAFALVDPVVACLGVEDQGLSLVLLVQD